MINVKSIAVVVLAIGLVVLAPKAIALTDEGNVTNDNNVTQTEPTETPTASGKLRPRMSNLTTTRTVSGDDLKTVAQEKLEAKKIEICQKREEVIKNTMTRMVDRGTKHIAVLSKISERVQTFYAEKGLTVDNYNDLLVNVVDAKAAAEAAVKQTGDQKETFNCDGYSPKTAAQNFVTTNHSQIDAVKAYHDAVVELLKAVKAAAESTSLAPTQTEGTSN